MEIPITINPEDFQKISFNDHVINNTVIHGILAYTNFGDWYCDMIDRVIPELNLMNEFIYMKFDILRFTNDLINGKIKTTSIKKCSKKKLVSRKPKQKTKPEAA